MSGSTTIKSDDQPVYSSAADSSDNNLAKALQAIQQLITEEEQMIQQMKDDIDQIQKDKDAIAKARHVNHTWHGNAHGGGYMTTSITYDHKAINRANADMSARQADLDGIEAKLNTMGFTDLVHAVNDLIKSWDNVRDHQDLGGYHDHDIYRDDVKKIEGFLSTIIQAMMVRVQQNADLALSKLEDDGSGTIDLQKIMLDSLSQMSAMAGLLGDLDSKMDTLFIQYGKDAQKAEVHKNGIAWWDEFMGKSKDRDRAIIRNAGDMQMLLVGLESDLAPLIASMSIDLAQLAYTINTIVLKILAILNDKSLSPEEKQEKLKATALELMTIVFGLISLVYTVSQKEKGKSDELQSQATGEAAQLNMVSMQAKQRIMEELKRIAHITEIVMKVAEFTIGIAMAVATGGAAGCLMAAVTVADTAFDLSSKLAEACGGGVGGAAAAAVIEMVLTAGAGALMEAGAKAAMQAATETVLTVVRNMLRTALRETVEEVAAQVAKTAADSSEPAVRAGVQMIEKTALDAAETAAKKTFDQIFRENGIGLILRALREGFLKNGLKSLEEMAKPAMEQAAREAAERSIQESSQVMTQLGKMADFTAGEMKLFDEAAETSANQAVAKVRNITPEKAEGVASEKSVLKYGAKAAFVGALYGIAQTHLTTEAAKANKHDDKTLEMILQVLDAVLLMVTQLLSGNFDYAMGNIVNTLVKGARGIQMAGMGAEVYSNEQLWEIGKKQGDVTTALGLIQSNLDMLNNMIQPAINQRQKDFGQQDSKEAEMQFQTTAQMAAQLWKYADKAAQELLA